MVSPATSTCPKCGAPRTEPACPRCGLRADKMDAYERSREDAVPEAVRAAWDKVAASWEDAALHDALFTLTTAHGAYAWTAARYRDACAGKPAGTADPHLERVRKAAEATLLATATARQARTKTPYGSSVLALAVIVLMIFVGLGLAMFMKGRKPHTDDAPRAPAKSIPGRPAAPSQVR